MGSYRLLKIIFVILLLVTFGEVGYYLFYQVVKIPQQESIKPTVSIYTIPTLLVPTDSIYKPTMTPAPNQAISMDAVYGLLVGKTGVLKTTIVSTQSIGEIVELNSNGGILPVTNYKYKIMVRIRGEGKNSNTFYYSENTLKKTELVEKIGDEENKIGIESFKIGDRVSIEQTTDLMKQFDSNLLRSKIIKIHQ